MSFTLDGKMLADSYRSMQTYGEMTADQRHMFWKVAQEEMPEMAKIFLKRFDELQDDEEHINKARLTGAVFFFLTIVNAIHAILPTDSIPDLISNRASEFPPLGKLPNLSRTQTLLRRPLGT